MSLDAAQYQDVAERLGHALRITRLCVERGTNAAGQLRYRPVEPTELLGRLLQMGYRVSLVPEHGGEPSVMGPDPAQRTLHLVPESLPQADGDDGA